MRVVHLVAIPRDFNGGADLRLVNTEGTRAVVAAMRRPASAASSTWARWASPTTRPSTTRAPRRRPRRSSASSGLGWTILKPSLQFGEGDGFFNIVAGLVRLSPGIVPVPGDGKARFQPIHVDDVAAVVVRVDRRPDLDRRLVRARRSALLDVPRDHPRGRSPRSASGALILPMPIPLIRLVAGTAERVRIPFPVATDQLRQLKLDNIGPLDLIPSRFGFAPRPMEGALGYLRDRQRDQVVAERPLDARPA